MRGTWEIGGHSVTRESNAVRRLLGVCPQELALYPELSATDNLVFFGRMAGLGGREAKQAAAEYLEVVGLTEPGPRQDRQILGRNETAG